MNFGKIPIAPGNEFFSVNLRSNCLAFLSREVKLLSVLIAEVILLMKDAEISSRRVMFEIKVESARSYLKDSYIDLPTNLRKPV